jgi:D-inositol-3-phosphate glycosyltransferase
MQRLAMLSLHTSPLAQPGTGDGGGMNVYVRELAAALARRGVSCDVFTRLADPDLPPVVTVEPGLRVHHIAAGPVGPFPKEHLEAVVPEFTEGVLEVMRDAAGSRDEPFEAVHANYWLSGLSGHVIKHEFDLPLVSTFHTLDRVKAEADVEELEAGVASRRADAEAAVIGCSDCVLASCSVEADQLVDLYGADPERIRIVAPGVDHAFFAPGHRAQARRALGLEPDGPLLLFVGRIQPLKRADVAVRTLAVLVGQGLPYRLVVVGGPSGPHGEDAYDDLLHLIKGLGVEDRVTLVSPQPHELLSTFYRAADVCLVTSKSESFGLAALESEACGTPVVASAVGGLTTLVEPGSTGYLVTEPAPERFAEFVTRIVDSPALAKRLSVAAATHARDYTWRDAAATLVDLYAELSGRRLVECR